MPELPDVEGFRRYWSATALHQAIVSVEVRAPGLLEGVSEAAMNRRLVDRAFASAHRHGKWLFVEVTRDGYLALHFGMTGGLAYFKAPAEAHRHARMVLDFDTGYRLAYIAARKLGHLALADDIAAFCRKRGLGPDALRIGRDSFVEQLGRRRGRIKTALMGQDLVAGLGNVWVDEALFQSGIHPETPCHRLPRRTLERLYRVMRRVLRVGIREAIQGGGFPSGYLRGHRTEGEPCPRCGMPLRRLRINQRSTYYCPRCQGESGAK